MDNRGMAVCSWFVGTIVRLWFGSIMKDNGYNLFGGSIITTIMIFYGFLATLDTFFSDFCRNMPFERCSYCFSGGLITGFISGMKGQLYQ